MANNYYRHLFHEEGNVNDWFQTPITFPHVDLEVLLRLQDPVTAQEVRMAMFGMGAWKAPGPDGFPPSFYHKRWDLLGGNICEFVQRMWLNPLELEVVNATNICLILKVDKPEFIDQFRPISLCNSIYKVVSKIVVNRLKELMPLIISPFQTGFVPGRHIHENIVVAQEMAHAMNCLIGKMGYLQSSWWTFQKLITGPIGNLFVILFKR